jgi:hypothetical protein
VNVHREVFALCRAFDVDPNVVRSLTLTPTSAEIEVFLRNEDGKKFIRPDGFVAMETIRFPISTVEP